MARAGVNSSCAEPRTPQARESSKVCAGKPSAEFFGIGQRPFDLHRYRMLFPDRWMVFLHRNFRNPVHVAFMFGVSDRTARNWWDGVSAPRAEFALAACKHVPGAAEFLMGAP